MGLWARAACIRRFSWGRYQARAPRSLTRAAAPAVLLSKQEAARATMWRRHGACGRSGDAQSLRELSTGLWWACFTSLTDNRPSGFVEGVSAAVTIGVKVSPQFGF